MEPGDLRINQQLGNDRGHSRETTLSSRQRSIYEHKSITGIIYPPYQIDRSVGPVSEIQNCSLTTSHPSTSYLVSRNQNCSLTASHPSTSCLVPNSLQQVKVWRDPHLISSTVIRHVDSPQHPQNFMAHHYSGSSGPGGIPPGANSPFLNSLPSPSMAITSPSAGLLATIPSTSSHPIHGSNNHLQSRAPGHYVPSKSNDPVWRPRYPTPAPPVPSNFIPLMLPQEAYRDFRTGQDVRDRRVDSKKTTDQAVQRHFDESLRLAEQKRWKLEEEQHARLPPNALPGGSAIMDNKPYFGPPSPHESKLADSKPVFSKVEAPTNPRTRDTTQVIQGRDLERSYLSSGSQVKSVPGYNYGPATLSRAKVSSPAPPQIYGKPDTRIVAGSSNVPSLIHFDPSDSAPLPLTSKISTQTREAPPLSSTLSTTSLPQHEVRTADLASRYMSYSMHPVSGGSYRPSVSVSALPIIKAEDQVQPLDLGGKRKLGQETMLPQILESKKVKSDEPPLDLKAIGGDMVINLTKKACSVTSLESRNLSESISSPISSALILSNLTTAATLAQTSLVSHSNPPVNTGSVTLVTSEKSHIAESEVLNNSLVLNTPESSIAATNSAVGANVLNTNNNSSSSPQKGTIKQGHKLKKHWIALHSGGDAVNPGDSPLSSRSLSPNSVSKGSTEYSTGVSDSDKPSTSNNSTGSNSSNGQMANIVRGGKSRRRAELNDESSMIMNGRSDTNDRSNHSLDLESDDDEDKQAGVKRKPPKGKRRNGQGQEKRQDTSPVDSASESEGDSDSANSSKGKDTLNSSVSSTPNQGSNLGGRKRGRKPRESSGSPLKNDRKKPNPFKRKSVHVLKKTLESFLQDGSCNEVAAKLGKCRECRWNPSTRSKKQTHPFCRFYAFRKLRYTKNGILATSGFSNPTTDASKEDKSLWLPSETNLPKCLELEMSKTLVTQLGDQFCELTHHERDAIEMNKNADTKVTAAWKRVIPGVRDMCDVCETTLFNFHWACGKCGFVVCIACYQSRQLNLLKPNAEPSMRDRERDKYQWLFCSNRQAHELDKVMLTQAIAGDSLNELSKLLHQMRNVWNIPQHCDCSEARQLGTAKKQEHDKSEANGALKTADAESSSSEDSDAEGDSTLKDILGRFNCNKDEIENRKDKDLSTPGQKCILGGEEAGGKDGHMGTDNLLKHFVRANGSSNYHRQLLPIRVCTLSESQSLYPTLPHSWLCAGRLLRLEDPSNPLNVKLFQDMWKRGQPVLVGNVDTRLNKSIWTPESFSKDFCELKSDLVNCISGKIVSNQSIKKFWDGFDNVKKRLQDNEGNPMLLKLKDWPPGEDFAELLPERFRDLMAALPLTDYTDRNGRLNLAARLPSNFVKPDLGPKMYIAYGSGLYLDKGTTNLHLDISDAVNVMVHVGVPKDVDNTDHLEAVREAIKDSDCDTLTIQKVIEKLERAGALWHIYNSRDADKIRDLLNKVAMERGDRLEPNHDPIHDQSWYLDRPLRKRLMEEYDVSGYPIVQCLGDAVFIPAGAPHQVRNLNNCIKIAEDFVSPENVSHCFDLTEEFRRLSDTHQNHEDKLQIKNIIYHAVKDAISVLMYGHSAEGSDESTSKSTLIANVNSSINE